MSRRYFFADTRGSTAITIAFSAPVLIAIAGAATMYAYQVTTKTQLQAALDRPVRKKPRLAKLLAEPSVLE